MEVGLDRRRSRDHVERFGEVKKRSCLGQEAAAKQPEGQTQRGILIDAKGITITHMFDRDIRFGDRNEKIRKRNIFKVEVSLVHFGGCEVETSKRNYICAGRNRPQRQPDITGNRLDGPKRKYLAAKEGPA